MRIIRIDKLPDLNLAFEKRKPQKPTHQLTLRRAT